MSLPRRLSAAAPLLLFLFTAPAAGASPVQVIAEDDHGVTLRVDLPAPLTSGIAPDARIDLRVPGFDRTGTPGRARVPYAHTLVALPPGARVTAAVIASDAEQVIEPIDVTRGPDPVTRVDPATGDLQPGLEPAKSIDGIWPDAPVVVGAPFTLRRQRLAAIEIYPYRYDPATRRLWTHRSMTVRVSFSGGTSSPLAATTFAPEDRHWDPALNDAVANFERGKRWRVGPSAIRSPNPLTARAGRAGPLRAATFDENDPEVRVQIDSTGAWALDYDDLAAHGYPAGVPIAEVSVHRHEFIENATPPYLTIELPCEVDDANSNGTFDSGDQILVWVQDWAERSQASVPQRYWGDAEVIYATRLSRGGLRMTSRPGWRNTATPQQLLSSPWTQHFERNFDYANSGSSPADTSRDPFHWTNVIAYYLRPDTIRFETNDLDTSLAAFVTVRWQGRANESHLVWGAVRNSRGQVSTAVDSSYFYGRTTLTDGGSIHGSALTEGFTNSFRSWGKTFLAPPDPTTNASALVGLDWFEVTYWRRYRALNSYLDCNSGSGDGEVELLARDFHDSTLIHVWDVSDSTAAVELTGVHFEPAGGLVNVRLQDLVDVSQRRRYVVFDNPKVPPSSSYSTVTRVGLSQSLAGDYLLVVPEAFLPAVDPLVQMHRNQGLQVVVAPLEAVFDEFNGGRHSAHAIKRFVRYGFDHWNTQFLLLVGDGTEDPKKIFPGSGNDWVPIMRIMGPVLATTTSGSFFEGVPSDPWYGWCMHCPDEVVAPKLPDVFVGRLPVNSLASAQAVVAKLVKYEQPQTDESWKRRQLLMSDDAYSGESTFGNGSTSSSYCYHSYEEIFREINENCGSVITNEAGLRQCAPDTFNVSYYLPTLQGDLQCAQPPPPDTCRCDRTTFQQRAYAIFTPQLMNRLNAGTLWWNYQGHANEYVMAHEAIYVNNRARDDKDLLRNDDKLFLLTAFSCHPNAFAHEGENGSTRGTPSFGEDLVTLPNRGAVASWASSGYELLPTDNMDHLNVHFARALFGDPPKDPYITTHGARPILGEVIAKALINLYPAPTMNERDVGITYTLLGDPASSISVGEPQALVTANTQPVTSGQRVALRTGKRDTLDVEADLVTNTRIDSITATRTEPNGAVTVMPPASYVITPAFPDTGAASGRGRHYHVSLTDTLLADSYHYTLRTVDRDNRATPFDVVFTFETIAYSSGNVLNDLDIIPPNAQLSLRVLSPRPLDPLRDLELRINGNLQSFTADSIAGDHTGREWLLHWNYPAYPFGQNVVQLKAANGATRVHRMQVTVTGAELRLQNPLAFPNPFDDDLGTYFSFTLESASAANVRIRVYTIAGKLVYERTESALTPGYHQIAWNGRDAEGEKLANGVYFYRIAASNGANSNRYEGRLVKLRKPHHEEEATP